jgi:hypothetical protein
MARPQSLTTGDAEGLTAAAGAQHSREEQDGNLCAGCKRLGMDVWHLEELGHRHLRLKELLVDAAS